MNKIIKKTQKNILMNKKSYKKSYKKFNKKSFKKSNKNNINQYGSGITEDFEIMKKNYIKHIKLSNNEMTGNYNQLLDVNFFNENEKFVLTNYKTSGFAKINRLLWSIAKNTPIQDLIKDPIYTSFAKVLYNLINTKGFRYNKPGIVFRNFQLFSKNNKPLEYMLQVKNLQKNQIIEFNSFISTSGKLIKKKDHDSPIGVIIIPVNTPFLMYDNEMEILLNPGKLIKISNVNEELKTKHNNIDIKNNVGLFLYSPLLNDNLNVFLNNNLGIMTFNTNNHKCNMSKLNFKDNKELQNLKFIFTQENSINNKFENFELINDFGGAFNMIGTYSKPDLESDLDNSLINENIDVNNEHEEFAPNLDGISKKYANMINYNNILICNLHLDGGRFFDRNILKLEKFKSYLDYKLLLLQKVLDLKPYIIVGDFNSVYSEDDKLLQKFLDSQYEYFKSINKGVELTNLQIQNIKLLNSEPFKLLKDNGYVYAKPINENSEITSARGNTIVDTIWYNPDTVVLVYNSAKIIPIMLPNDNYENRRCINSDHNPVYAEFIKIEQPNLDIEIIIK
jgi:hypothetical protein